MTEHEAEGPAIAGPVVAAMRALLRERGVWDSIMAELEERGADTVQWITRPDLPAWVALDDYGKVLDAAAAVVEPATFVELGRARVEHDLRGGYFGGMLRGWLRSVGSSSSDLPRICIHMWKGATRDAGEMSVVEAGEDFLRFAVRDAAPLALESRPWHLVLSGIIEGVLAAGKLTGTASFRRLESEPKDVIEVLVRWTTAG